MHWLGNKHTQITANVSKPIAGILSRQKTTPQDGTVRVQGIIYYTVIFVHKYQSNVIFSYNPNI